MDADRSTSQGGDSLQGGGQDDADHNNDDSHGGCDAANGKATTVGVDSPALQNNEQCSS